MKRQIRFSLLLMSLLCLVSAAIAASQRAALTAVRQVEEGILLELDGTVVFWHSTLPNPHRVIVDVLQTTQTMQPDLSPDQHVIINLQQGALQRVRVGQMGNNLRVVFDLTTSLRYQVTRVGGGLLVSFAGNKPVALPRPVPTTPKMPDAIPLSTVLPVSATNLRDTAISVPVEAATPDAQRV